MSVKEKDNNMHILLLLLLFISNGLFAQENTYPTKERVFHIERSKNKNLVCYDVNLKDGKLDQKNPLHVYWVDREEKPGSTKELTAIQKKMAYGYKIMTQDDESCQLLLNSYDKKVILLRKEGEKYVCIVEINGQPSIVQSFYVKAKESNSLRVEYVEIRGITLEGQEIVTERVTG